MNLRPATLDDAALLFAWRNDPATRHASRNHAAITAEEHRAWLLRSLSNRTRRLYLAEVDGTPVGTCRSDLTEHGWELSWTIATEHRRQGYGRTMVGLLVEQTPQPYFAEIYGQNTASVRIAEQCGIPVHVLGA